MRLFWSSTGVALLYLYIAAAAQEAGPPMKMQLEGRSVDGTVSSPSYNIQQFPGDLPTAALVEVSNNTNWEIASSTRSAKDVQIYRAVSPSVVLILTKDGLGSGSLIGADGTILTNWHVVKGYDTVAVVYKPTSEGKQPTRDEIKRGQVIKVDEIADLALVKAFDVPSGRVPIRLGNSNEIAVGADVHAIGHPTGEAWTYTTGVISQYRQAYEWQAKGLRHQADIIQTQTPINPGNSGGPLLGDGGTLIGVNSFKTEGEALNFAVSVDEIKKFVARSGDRTSQSPKVSKSDKPCRPKELSKFRNDKNDSTITAFDMFCSGKDTGELVIPDDVSQAIFLNVDRNGDGQVDLKIFDLKRSGRWDLSFWDEKFDGHWTLVGYHDDGGLKPTRFESYTEFQKRTA